MFIGFCFPPFLSGPILWRVKKNVRVDVTLFAWPDCFSPVCQSLFCSVAISAIVFFLIESNTAVLCC